MNSTKVFSAFPGSLSGSAKFNFAMQQCPSFANAELQLLAFCSRAFAALFACGPGAKIAFIELDHWKVSPEFLEDLSCSALPGLQLAAYPFPSTVVDSP